MLGCLLRLLVFFLIAQFVSIRGLKGGGPLDVPGAVAVWYLWSDSVFANKEPVPQMWAAAQC